MIDSDCVQFLQWALPHRQMRWPGFRKVHKRVCTRLARRLNELGLDDISAYRQLLTQQPQEWQHFDTVCRVVVTRFYRDKRVFAELTERILPQLADNAFGRRQLHVWSIGSASGEEPYSLAIVWQQLLAPRFPYLHLSILATEIEPVLLERSRRACYERATLKNLPESLRSAAFTEAKDGYCLKQIYQELVEFRQQDIRTTLPDEQFDLILCRNLVFTYFDEPLQQQILQQLVSRLRPGGWLVLGVHETLPAQAGGLRQEGERWLGIYRRSTEESPPGAP